MRNVCFLAARTRIRATAVRLLPALKGLSAAFLVSAEFEALYGANPTVETFLNDTITDFVAGAGTDDVLYVSERILTPPNSPRAAQCSRGFLLSLKRRASKHQTD